MTPVTRDPLDVPIEEKVALLFAANEAALKVQGVRFVTSGMQLLREIKTFVNTEGTERTQTFIRVGPSFSATARRRQRRLPGVRARSSRRAARAGSTSVARHAGQRRARGRRSPSRSSRREASSPGGTT